MFVCLFVCSFRKLMFNFFSLLCVRFFNLSKLFEKREKERERKREIEKEREENREREGGKSIIKNGPQISCLALMMHLMLTLSKQLAKQNFQNKNIKTKQNKEHLFRNHHQQKRKKICTFQSLRSDLFIMNIVLHSLTCGGNLIKEIESFINVKMSPLLQFILYFCIVIIESEVVHCHGL